MLYVIKDLDDPLIDYLKDDPVRPHIPVTERVGPNRHVFVLTEHDKVKAIVCAKLCATIPSNENELLSDINDKPVAAIFYTIWSYESGSGQQLIREGVKHIKSNMPDIKRFVTLSPTTEMARKFHIRNGAVIFRVNLETINYEYTNI